MSYIELVNYIFTLRNRDIQADKKDLMLMIEASKILGDPHKAFRAIHITGTNGKGSVAWKLANLIRAAGYTVGLYTSPHLFSYRERIRVNGELISEAAVVTIIKEVIETLNQHGISLGFFEITTLAAFCYFKQKNVDFAVIEVGIGGRLDPTNIIMSELAIITSIGLEHTALLGDTIEKITLDKCGIIKPNRPVVIGPQVPVDIVKHVACRQKATVITVERASGDNFELENQLIARAAFKELARCFALPDVEIDSLIQESPPCRFECFSYDQLATLNNSFEALPKNIIFDVAHNPPAFECLFKRIGQSYAQRVQLILGMSADKDINSCIAIFKPFVTAVHAVCGEYDRLMSAELITKKCQAKGVTAFYNPSLFQTLDTTFKTATKQNELVVVAGSFFIMKNIRKLLGMNDPCDN